MLEPNRIQPGVSEGGQFATGARAEAQVSLSDLSPHVADQVLVDIQERLEATRDEIADLQAYELELQRKLTAMRGEEQPEGALHAAPNAEAPHLPASLTSAPDEIEHPVHGTFTKLRPGVHPAEFDQVRIQLNRPITPDDAHHVAAAFGYMWATAGGESVPEPELDGDNALIVFADATKVRNWGAIGDMPGTLRQYLREGSPRRLTDRAGPGTAGTRLIQPMEGARDSYAHIYVSDAFIDDWAS